MLTKYQKGFVVLTQVNTDPIRLLNDFSGACVGQCVFQGQRVMVRFREETPTFVDGMMHDYNYHFSFGLENLTDQDQMLDILINMDDREEPALKYDALIFQSDQLSKDFVPFDGKAKTDTYRKYLLRTTISACEKRYFANFYFRSYEKIINTIETYAKDGQAVRKIYGQSLEQRALVSYTYPALESDKACVKTILITSGFHFPEQDTLAMEAIMSFLNSLECRQRYRSFRFVLIPIVNPDGFVHGWNGCNAAGINLYWKFDTQDISSSPETKYLWDFLQDIKPMLYFDFHSYTFQLHRKKASPYLKPCIFYRGKDTRHIVKQIDKALMRINSGYVVRGFSTYAPSVLATRLTREMNTITYAKYHLALKDGVGVMKDNAVQAVTQALEVIKQYPSRESFSNKDSLWACFCQRIMMLVYYRIRPYLGKIKRALWT